MKKRSWGVAALLLVIALVALAASLGGGILWRWPLAVYESRRATWTTAPPDRVTIPFDLVAGHIVLEVTVNGSRPLSFVLDTGDRFAIIDPDLARELGLTLAGEIRVKGVGSQSTGGAFVHGARFIVQGLPAFSQAITMALPVRPLASRLGREFDGVLGADFIQNFVVEIDYQKRSMTLYDKDNFRYSGPGEAVAMRLNGERHLVIEAEVTPVGEEPIRGDFLLDLGASGAVVLDSPFVAEHHLPGSRIKTMKALGGGVGGASEGETGPLAKLRIGRFSLSNPSTLLSRARAGAYADPDLAGAVNHQVVRNCRVFLDYSHGRVILEPIASFDQVFDRASSGLRVEAEGEDYKTFRVKEVLEDSPASEAGLRQDDVIAAIDQRAAASLTLSDVLESLERAIPCELTVTRGDRTLRLTIVPRQSR